MFRTPLAAAIALSIALVGLTPAPVRAAEPADIARAVGGLAALYFIGKAITKARDRDDDDDDDDDDRQEVARADTTPGHGFGRDRDGWSRPERPAREWVPHTGRGRDAQRDPKRGRAEERLLPAGCATRGHVRGIGTAEVYGAQCLSRGYRGAAALPGVCRVDYTIAGARRSGFEAECLRDFGYRAASRR